MTFVAWNGVLGGAVTMGAPATVIMGSVLMGLLAATTLALVLGAEQRPVRRDPVIALRSRLTSDRAAAA